MVGWNGGGIRDLTGGAPYNLGAGRTVSGTGTVMGALDISGTLSPGFLATTPAPNVPGTLTTEAITLASSATFAVDLDSSATTADRLVVSGNVTLSSATIAVTDVATSPLSLPGGTVLKLIDYTGHTLTGTFQGQPEGSALTVGSNPFVIRYAADTNNDTLPDAVLLEIQNSGYEAWVSARGLAGANAAFDADPNADGIKNGFEFVLGGEPNPANPGSPSSSVLPVSTQPSGNLVFSFKRADASEAGVQLAFQWSADLSFPPSNQLPIGPVDTNADGITVDFTEDSPNSGTDTIVVTVPAAKAAGGRIFGRISATQP